MAVQPGPAGEPPLVLLREQSTHQQANLTLHRSGCLSSESNAVFPPRQRHDRPPDCPWGPVLMIRAARADSVNACPRAGGRAAGKPSPPARTTAVTFTEDQLNDIYDRSGGKCHLCLKRLAFRNYGRPGERAAWEVDHSRARARGGGDRLSNLRPACISCNRSKQASSTLSARRRNGVSRAPLSFERRSAARRRNAAAGASIGAAIGARAAGPGAGLIGALLGAAIGHDLDPDGRR